MSCSSKRTQLSARRAFTLVELLVVVAIIALLVSILMPSLNKAKDAARLVICQTNMHAIGRAAFMYAAENNDCVPRDSAWSWNDPDEGNYLFASRFSHYMGGPKVPWAHEFDDPYLYDVFKEIDAYQCPSFEDKRFMLTYLTNGWNFTNPEDDWTPAYPLTNLTRNPAEIGYIMEINPSNEMKNPTRETVEYGRYDCLGYLKADGTIHNYDLIYNEDGTVNGLTPETGGRMIHAHDDRHRGRTSVVFFDGHAESRRLEKPRPDDADLTDADLPLDMFFAYP